MSTATTEIATRPAGEVAQARPAPPRPALFEGFEGAAAQPFDDYARMVLAEPVDPRDVEIRPDGIVYLSGVWYRRQLTRAFGAGGWAIVPRSAPQKMGEMVVYHGALVVLGRFVSEAMGECETRAKMSYASSLEGARTDCITRCCKDLGMASELWDRSWRDAWIRDCARKGSDGKWYKNDGAEHDMVPLFVPQPLSPGAAATKPASPPTHAAPSSTALPRGVTSDPKDASVATAPSTTRRAAAATASTSSAPSSKRTSGAADIKHDGRMTTGEQVKLIHVLRAKIPTLAATPDDPRSKWKQLLQVYRRQDGTRCEHSNELSTDGASHLIDRLQAKVDELDAKEREIRAAGTPVNDGGLDAQDVRTPVGFCERMASIFPSATDERAWLESVGYSDSDQVPVESRLPVAQLAAASKGEDSEMFTRLLVKAFDAKHISKVPNLGWGK